MLSNDLRRNYVSINTVTTTKKDYSFKIQPPGHNYFPALIDYTLKSVTSKLPVGVVCCCEAV